MNYVIVTEGRAGSTLLMQHLTQMGIGKPYVISENNLRERGIAFSELPTYIESKRRNGILGVKLSWGILMGIDKERKVNMHDFIESICADAKYIYQTRRDRVHQALSRIKHLKLDTSHVHSESEMAAYQKKESERLSADFVPITDIEERVLNNARGYQAWNIYFRAYAIMPHVVIFEDLVSQRDVVLERLCHFLGVPCQLDMLEDELMSTHTEINDAWYNRMLEGFTKYL